MELVPKKGTDLLKFGMKREAVEKLLGKPDRKYTDEDSNEIYLYNEVCLSLTFYEDEAFRLGYLVTSNPGAKLFETQPIGKTANEVIGALPQKQFRNWESEWDLSLNHYFNEDNWVILTEEFGRIVKVEIGAALVKDEFVWAV